VGPRQTRDPVVVLDGPFADRVKDSRYQPGLESRSGRSWTRSTMANRRGVPRCWRAERSQTTRAAPARPLSFPVRLPQDSALEERDASLAAALHYVGRPEACLNLADVGLPQVEHAQP